MKTILFLLLPFALAAVWLPIDLEAQDFRYTVSDGQVTITGYNGPGGVVTIPERIEGLPVAQVGSYAFYGQNSVASVTIPHGVTTIGSYAFFACTSLASVTIPNSVTNIGWAAFGGCTSLNGFMVDAGNQIYSSLDGVLFNKLRTTLMVYPEGKGGAYVVPESVTTIGANAFFNCTSLTSAIIQNGVTNMGWEAFRGCTSLVTVSIPDSVTSIEESTFNRCTSLTSMTIPNSVTNIGWAAFGECTSLVTVSFPDGVTTLGDNAFRLCTSLASVTIPNRVTSIGDSVFNQCTSLTNVTIPNSVTNIGWAAFGGCTSLVSVSIPDSVTTIGHYAFAGCTSLASVTIPNSVDSIELWAFLGCSNLSGISVDAGNANYSSLDGVLFNEDRTTLIEYPGGKSGAYLVPNSVTSIGGNAFSDCTSLTSVIFPDGLTSIEGSAFRGCTNLINVGFPGSLTRIGYDAFSGCTGLTSVQIPDSVDSIGLWAFLGCNKLASISVDARNANYSSLDGVLFNKDRTILYQCPGGKTGSYVIPDSVTSIMDRAFFLCTSLVNVTIPDGVTSIEGSIKGGTFGGCTSLTSVTIPSSMTSIGCKAFSGCAHLRSVYSMGDAPYVCWGEYPTFDSAVTVYYRAGTTGWEETFGGWPAVLWIPEEDLDHDGMTNQQEFMAGTDPSDAQSLLAFEGGARLDELAEDDQTPLPPGQFALYFKSIPGRSYVIQSTEMLGGEWRQEATVAAGRAIQKRVVLDRPPNRAFYRLQLDAAE